MVIAILADLAAGKELLAEQVQARRFEGCRLDEKRLGGRRIAADVRRQVGKRRTQDSTSFCPLVERRKRSVAAEGSDLAASGHGALASKRGGKPVPSARSSSGGEADDLSARADQ